MVAAALAALPLAVLVAYSSIDRYQADKDRAVVRATNRAELLATLLAEGSGADVPSQARVRELSRLGRAVPGNVVVVYQGGRIVARTGPDGAAPGADADALAAALARGSGVFSRTGADGIDRVWGLKRVGRGPVAVLYGLPGDAVYGSARTALRRDLLLAAASVLLVLLAAYLLAGRVAAPIRRLAERIADEEDDDGGAGEIGAIERGVLRHLSERRKLEDRLRQAQKMESIGQLAGGVAHDFNNLLTVISGYGEIARHVIGAGPGAEELTEIRRAAERGQQLTHQLLAFSRQQVLDPALLDLSEVARQLSGMFGRLIGEDITIAMRLADELPPVMADRSQIEQVIINLVVNARDAMPRGGTLTIETRIATCDVDYLHTHPGATPGRCICLVVTDTGTGIEKDKLAHIFEPFFTSKPPGQGTGLGLATVHGVVTQSGGRIEAYSELDLGTTFKIYLPAIATTATPRLSTPASRDVDADQPPLATGTILVCEDDPAVRLLLQRCLTMGGYDVIAADRPAAAIELVDHHTGHIDALVSDIVMPDMSGPDLARHLDELPVLFLSGYTAETVHERAELPPGSRFLEKPFTRAALLAEITALLDERTTARARDIGHRDNM
jgi:signal transduction histidine kinase/ActR/RegA family two-component response regulator